jgi:hypothetical protein
MADIPVVRRMLKTAITAVGVLRYIFQSVDRKI